MKYQYLQYSIDLQLGDYHVNKYESPNWYLSPSDITLRLDSVGLDVPRA